jgi:uncharacterized protein (TIGR02453 family)
MGAHFTETAVKFLRGLAKHNDREWFDTRKNIYETELKAPMLAVIEEINAGLEGFAPEHVRPPQKCMMRIYRDIRFSKNKQPYKTNLAAWWARKGLEKTSGGGFYFQFSPDEVLVAGGAYMPEKDQVLAIRRHLHEHHEEYRHLLKAKKMQTLMTEFDPIKMTRPPKGFQSDSPALDLILQRQWGVSAKLPLETALGPGLVKAVLERMKVAAPLVAFLNAPLLAVLASGSGPGGARKPLF